MDQFTHTKLKPILIQTTEENSTAERAINILTVAAELEGQAMQKTVVIRVCYNLNLSEPGVIMCSLVTNGIDRFKGNLEMDPKLTEIVVGAADARNPFLVYLIEAIGHKEPKLTLHNFLPFMIKAAHV